MCLDVIGELGRDQEVAPIDVRELHCRIQLREIPGADLQRREANSFE
jgi:hypothetical protein